MQIVPAVDLVGTDATRLVQGDFARELFRRPAVEWIAEIAAAGPALIHLVDLDGARTGVVRTDVLRACLAAAGSVPVQVSGGVRSIRDAEALVDLGFHRVLIGTAAFGPLEQLAAFATRLGDRLAVAIDVRGGRVRVAGWSEDTSLPVAAAARRCVDQGVARVLGTAIEADGTGRGPDLSLYRELCGFDLAVMAAGGVRDLADVAALVAVGCEAVILGRAVADGAFRSFEPRSSAASG